VSYMAELFICEYLQNITIVEQVVLSI